MKTEKRVGRDFIIGWHGFAQISAIEGIQITPTMEADFEEFDRQDLSTAERRKVIAKKYGKVR